MLASGPELRDGRDRAGVRSVLLALVAALSLGVNNLALARGSAHHVTATLLGNAAAGLVLYGCSRWPRRHVPRAI